ncbi:MAG: inositol monophosphatase family protein [Candidatus Thorarchaeota archaeon]
MSDVIDERSLKEYLEFATRVSVEAGNRTMQYFRKTVDVDKKSDDTEVTIADREAEMFIREQIQTSYPSHSILGEEFEAKQTESTFNWVIDPIDGTQSFVRGVPLYSVLLALEFESTPCVGVIHIPPLQETVAAAIDVGCFHNGTPCSVTNTPNLSQAWVQVTDIADLSRRRPEFTEKLLSKARFFRTWGDAYGYLLVATGRADVMIDPIMSRWDISPLHPIITEAGGKFTDLDGNPTPTGESALGSNGVLHEAILDLL